MKQDHRPCSATGTAAKLGEGPGACDIEGERSEEGDVVESIIVRCRGLQRTYRSGARETNAVRGVDLDVRAGEWVAIMGPSGCGKSSLLHLLGGLDTPDAGTVVVDGESVGELSETRRALMRRSRIGYVFQFFNLVQDFTVAENIELPMLLAGATRGAARQRRRELLDAVGLSDLADASPAQLSGGQQQRVAIARALANRPGVLLADEPTGNLDTESARAVLGLLRDQHDAGQTIVMVTHDARVAAVADRLLVMEDGRITSSSGAADAMAPTLADLTVTGAR
jgi:putative ABC transport system ATP-binding protein